MGPLRPRGLVQEKDQKLFQLPLLLFCMEHNFKHRTSERAANHSYTHTTHIYMFLSVFYYTHLPAELKPLSPGLSKIKT